jgi:hypothetical protein
MFCFLGCFFRLRAAVMAKMGCTRTENKNKESQIVFERKVTS